MKRILKRINTFFTSEEQETGITVLQVVLCALGAMTAIACTLVLTRLIGFAAGFGLTVISAAVLAGGIFALRGE